MKVLHLAFEQIISKTDKIDGDHDSEKIPLQLLQCIEILYDNVPLSEDDQMMVSSCSPSMLAACNVNGVD